MRRTAGRAGYLTLVADLYGEGILARDMAAFEEEMARTKVDWQLHAYGGAVHSFTNPEADNLGAPAFAYNEAADRRSWSAMLGLLQEAFA